MADDIARDLPSLRAGQRLFVGVDGSVVSAARQRRGVASWMVLVAAGHALLVIAAPPIGIPLAVADAAATVQLHRWTARLREAIELATADRVDEAERRLAALGSPLLWRRRRRANVELARAIIAERRGDLAGAVGHAEHCARLLPKARGTYGLMYWQNHFNRTAWLIELGRLDDARIALARCGEAPAGEWYRLQWRSLILRAAFAGAAEIPDETRLYDWFRDALRYNHTGLLLVVLGWALDRRGDAGSAQHAFAEANTRFGGKPPRFATIYPSLWAALGPRVEAAATDYGLA